MTCRQCEGIELVFNEDFARDELRRFRRKGPRATTQMLIDGIRNIGVNSRTLLDIGGGVGALQLALLESGFDRATSVDASSSYLAAAREEARRRGLSDRIEYVYRDFVEASDELGEYDVVTLDRVICCYDNMPALVRASVGKARRIYALVYPRETWWTRAFVAAANAWFRLRRNPMRTFIHSQDEVDRLVREAGFSMEVRRTTPIWQAVVYRRFTP